MIDWLDALVGLGIGLLLGGMAATVLVLVRRGRLATEVSNARARAELLDERLKAQTEDEDRLKAVFRSLGAEALQANNEQFTELATATLKVVLAEATGDADKRKLAVENLVKPVKELLERQNLAVTEIEKKREVAYRGLEEQIKSIAASHQKLGDETNRLVAALRRPEQRGRWGEMQLRNAVEMAGMTPHCDFTEQPQTDDPETRDRPDMIVRLPGGGVIVVDSKVALDAYLDTLDANVDRDEAMQRHAGQVAEHCRRLSAKRYWEQFERTPKLVVLFMPGAHCQPHAARGPAAGRGLRLAAGGPRRQRPPDREGRWRSVRAAGDVRRAPRGRGQGDQPGGRRVRRRSGLAGEARASRGPGAEGVARDHRGTGCPAARPPGGDAPDHRGRTEAGGAGAIGQGCRVRVEGEVKRPRASICLPLPPRR
jgi:hypothetical protein